MFNTALLWYSFQVSHSSGGIMDISIFMESFKDNLLSLFNDNLLFLGIQGSYGRSSSSVEKMKF